MTHVPPASSRAVHQTSRDQLDARPARTGIGDMLVDDALSTGIRFRERCDSAARARSGHRVDALRVKMRENVRHLFAHAMELMKHLTETDRAHVKKLMDEMLEKLLLGRRNDCEARKNSGGRFKTSKHCAICFFRTGRRRENPADWHARQHACQMAGGIRSQETVCGQRNGSGKLSSSRPAATRCSRRH